MSAATGELLQLTDVSVEFSGIKALRDLSMSVHPGEWLGVIGPNGSGKTTLMNVVMGVYPPAEGTIVFAGADISSSPPLAPARRGIVRSFQHDQLAATLTLAENVALGLVDRLSPFTTAYWMGREKRTLGAARDGLAEVGCAEYAELLPREVPQGVRRLTEIARAIIADTAALLLLDEPAAGLSDSERNRLRDVLEQLRVNRPALAVVLIEHDVAFVADETTRVVALDAGTKIGDGPTAEVLRSEAVGIAFLGRTADADD